MAEVTWIRPAYVNATLWNDVSSKCRKLSVCPKWLTRHYNRSTYRSLLLPERTRRPASSQLLQWWVKSRSDETWIGAGGAPQLAWWRFLLLLLCLSQIRVFNDIRRKLEMDRGCLNTRHSPRAVVVWRAHAWRCVCVCFLLCHDWFEAANWTFSELHFRFWFGGRHRKKKRNFKINAVVKIHLLFRRRHQMTEV